MMLDNTLRLGYMFVERYERKVPVNVRLLRKIAKVIQLPENKRQFDMIYWHCDKTKKDPIHGHFDAKSALCDLPKEKQISCTTSHCIAGWAQVLDPNRNCHEHADYDGQRLLELNNEQAGRLFDASKWPTGFGKWRSTPQQAAARIEHFIKTKGDE